MESDANIVSAISAHGHGGYGFKDSLWVTSEEAKHSLLIERESAHSFDKTEDLILNIEKKIR